MLRIYTCTKKKDEDSPKDIPVTLSDTSSDFEPTERPIKTRTVQKRCLKKKASNALTGRPEMIMKENTQRDPQIQIQHPVTQGRKNMKEGKNKTDSQDQSLLRSVTQRSNTQHLLMLSIHAHPRAGMDLKMNIQVLCHIKKNRPVVL
ncbi:uncharacterized protein KZ484_008223 [Pholidichthys leucotaenia]